MKKRNCFRFLVLCNPFLAAFKKLSYFEMFNRKSDNQEESFLFCSKKFLFAFLEYILHLLVVQTRTLKHFRLFKLFMKIWLFQRIFHELDIHKDNFYTHFTPQN